jgi:hypothetical protein
MALIFLESFDKYGAANSNNTVVSALLTAGEWTSALTASTFPTVVAGLNGLSGFAVLLGGTANVLSKTLAGNYSRLIGGHRFANSLAAGAGIQFLDAGTVQASIQFNTTGTFSVRNGIYTSGTVLGTSTASVTANTTHYLEWDFTFGNSGSYQLWLDGVSILSGSGDTTATANNFANQFQFIAASNATGLTVDDLYLFDTTGTTNNAVLLTSPRIETQFPTSDGAVQFAAGAAIIGSSVSRTATTVTPAANELRLRPITPAVNCTITAVGLLPGATSAAVQQRPVVYTDLAGVPNTLMSAGSTVTGTTANVAKTMPLTTPQALTAGTQYWAGFMCDILVSGGMNGLDGTNTNRIATATFASGAPGTAPTTTASLSTVIWGSVTTAAGNWYAAGQNPPQGSASYVFDATVGHEELYAFPALSASAPTIYAVAVKANLAKSDAGAKTVSMRVKSGSVDSAGSVSSAAPGTTYGWLTSLFPTDPNTSAAWSLAALNAAQAGVKVES